MGRGDRSGDDVDFGLQPDAGHAHRVLDPGLLIDDIFLGQDVDHLSIHGNGHGTGGIDDPLHIGFGDLGPLDGDDAAAVEAGDVPAGDAGVDRGYLAAGHQFGLFHGFFNGIHRGFDIDHHALAKPDRRGGCRYR